MFKFIKNSWFKLLIAICAIIATGTYVVTNMYYFDTRTAKHLIRHNQSTGEAEVFYSRGVIGDDYEWQQIFPSNKMKSKK